MKFERRQTSALDPITDALAEQNEIVGRARNSFLQLKAEKDTFESKMIKQAEGKSQAEKRMNAEATEEWLEFHKRYARAEAVYEFEKFKLQVIDKEWLAQYQSQKDNDLVIKRQA